jgi:hypothetical protein
MSKELAASTREMNTHPNIGTRKNLNEREVIATSSWLLSQTRDCGSCSGRDRVSVHCHPNGWFEQSRAMCA